VPRPARGGERGVRGGKMRDQKFSAPRRHASEIRCIVKMPMECGFSIRSAAAAAALRHARCALFARHFACAKPHR
jgi:hypothetical protein